MASYVPKCQTNSGPYGPIFTHSEVYTTISIAHCKTNPIVQSQNLLVSFIFLATSSVDICLPKYKHQFTHVLP